MDISVANPIDMGKGIVDTGFIVTTAAFYLIYSAIIIFFFVKWFVRLVNEILKDYRQTMTEILLLQKKIYEIIKTLE